MFAVAVLLFGVLIQIPTKVRSHIRRGILFLLDLNKIIINLLFSIGVVFMVAYKQLRLINCV